LLNAVLVAYFVILLAKMGPKSWFQNVQTPVIPAKISPIPLHLFLPPSISQINDLLPKIMSLLPFKIAVKFVKEKSEVISVSYSFVL